MNARQIIGSMYRKKYERENSDHVCIPYFQRIIGIETEKKYNDELKTLQTYMDDFAKLTVFFEGMIPVVAEFELIENIKTELMTMDIANLSCQEIFIFPTVEVNTKFLNALEKTVSLAVTQENFFSEHVRNDFIAKLIVWAYTYLRSLEFDGHYLPKCVYYGNITAHEIYFLILAYQMDIDVLYLNPLKDENFAKVDTGKLSDLHMEMGISPIETFAEKANRGEMITNIETITKKIESDIHSSLFSGTGIYKPWQFRHGYTKTYRLDTILEDVFVYWDQEARLREGFKTNDLLVSIPCFFLKVDGIYEDKQKYKDLVQCCTNSANTYTYRNGEFSDFDIKRDDFFQLMFCQRSDGTYEAEEIKKLPFYRFGKYAQELQDFIISKANELIQADHFFVTTLSNEQKMECVYRILNLNEELVRAIDNFDFTKNIPKIVIFLENETTITFESLILLCYFSIIGFDIIIFNPSGTCNPYSVVEKSIIFTHRLAEMNYQMTYSNVLTFKKSLFNFLGSKR